MHFTALLAVIFVLLSVSTAINLSPHGNPLSIQVDQDGSYTINVEGEKWLSNGLLQVLSFREWQQPQFVGSSDTKGQDAFGVYHEHRISWKFKFDVPWETAFRVYDSQPIILFEQLYPRGMNATSTPDTSGVSATFPSFDLGSQVCPSYYFHFSFYCYED